jgi:hypothetical protein
VSDPKGTVDKPSALEQIALQLSDALARNKALETRLKFLEDRLAQRFAETVQEYKSSNFDGMRDMCMKVFLNAGPEAELTMEEAVEEFKILFPGVNSLFVPRRILELSQPDGKFGHKLGRKQDSDGTARYFLWLKEEPVQVASGVLEETVSQ